VSFFGVLRLLNFCFLFCFFRGYFSRVRFPPSVPFFPMIQEDKGKKEKEKILASESENYNLTHSILYSLPRETIEVRKKEKTHALTLV